MVSVSLERQVLGLKEEVRFDAKTTSYMLKPSIYIVPVHPAFSCQFHKFFYCLNLSLSFETSIYSCSAMQGLCQVNKFGSRIELLTDHLT